MKDIAAHTEIRVSENGQIGSTTLPMTVPGWEVEKEQGEQLIAAAEKNSGDGLQIKLGGDPIYTAQEQASPEGLGFLGAAIVLLIAFGSVVAAGLPLVIALVGLGISSGGLIVLLANVVDVPDWTTAVSGLIGIGVGIDYSLLVLTRFRTAMDAGKDRHDAVLEAVTTAGRSVMIAGATVVVAVLGLILTGLAYMVGVALAASSAVLVVMLASITLLPSLLSYLGPNVDRWRLPLIGRRRKKLEEDRDVSESPAARWSHAVQRRPWLAAISATLLLLLLALPALGMRLGFPDAGNDPPSTMTRQAYDLNTEGFGPGSNGPLVIAAELPDESGKAEVEAFADQVRGDARRRLRAAGPVQRRRPCGARDRDPEDLPGRRGDDGAGHATARRRRAADARRGRHRRQDRRRHRGARGPERLHDRPHAGVLHRRRRPLVPAAAGRLPLTADLAQGRGDEPALGRRRLRRDDALRPGRNARRS